VRVKCPECYGEGMVGGCPRCGTVERVDVVVNQNMPLLDGIIPQAYQNSVWMMPKFTEKTDPGVVKFYDNLNKCHELCLNGVVPPYSIYLSDEPKSDKFSFLYSCMQALLLAGIKVSPLLSTADIRRLLVSSQLNPRYKLYDRWTYNYIMGMELLVVSVTHLQDRFDDITVLRELLDTRSRLDLVTWCISDYRLESLAPRWDSDVYLTIYNLEPGRDLKKFPVILQNL